MRIAGYIKHPTYKITIFHMNNRYSIKFENGQYEQTYKLREGDLFNNAEQVKTLVDEDFLSAVQNQFKLQNQSFQAAYERILSKEEDEFDEII
jgi:hypothetical protein